MNYRLIIVGFLLVSFTGCKETLDVEFILSCKSELPKDLVRTQDFKNNFSVPIPKTWKINHYYTKNQSELFAADTLKQLSESYILDVSFNQGVLKFNDDFYRVSDSLLKINNLRVIRSGLQDFKGNPTHWRIVTGEKNGFLYHEFNWTILKSENTYVNAHIEVYGEENINERICESTTILKELEFVE